MVRFCDFFFEEIECLYEENLRVSCVTGLISMQAAYSGDISGTVMLKGTPPPEKENTQIKADAIAAAAHRTRNNPFLRSGR